MSDSTAVTDILSITTPLGPDSFVITSLQGMERLNRPFEYHVELQAGAALLNANDLLDNAVTVTIGEPGNNGRFVNGIVASVKQLPYSTTDTVWQYSLKIVPRLYFLGQTKDSRFWHNMTVPAIVEAILGKFSVAFKSNLQGSYTARDYNVQFNESYLQFIQRILEDEGIFYFFTHTSGAHTMVLADSKTAFQSINNPDMVLHNQTTGYQGLLSFRREDSTALGAVTVDDYNPQTNTLTTAGQAIRGKETTVLEATGASQRQHYSWPAVRGTASDAAARAKWRMQAAEGAAQLYHGAGSSPNFIAGGKFSLADDPMGVSDYVIHTVNYLVRDTVTGGRSGSSQNSVVMNFTAFPAKADWREAPSIAPPSMPGLYTAKVIGPQGEEIYTDDLGRIKVWFPWDNQSDITPDNTFWARVVQPWAGANWGTQFIPRIGMEVAVAFLEGDVNRPVVVGSLYNNANTPVFAPADKNKSGIRTRSTLKGGSANFNEFSFDDTKGSELFFLHAEKDYTLEVEHDQTLTIDNCRMVTVTKDETVQINGKQSITVKGDQSRTISQGDQSLTLSAGSRSVSIAKDETITISGKQSVTVTGDQNFSLNGGAVTISISNGAVSYTAQQSITLTVGGSSISITPSSISISAMSVSISGDTSVSVSGADTSISGEGGLTLSGATVMIG